MTLRIWWIDNHGKLTYHEEKKKENDTKKWKESNMFLVNKIVLKLS